MLRNLDERLRIWFGGESIDKVFKMRLLGVKGKIEVGSGGYGIWNRIFNVVEGLDLFGGI